MLSRSVQSEVCAAVRGLLSSVPPYGASSQQRADYQTRKAEVLDLIAAVDPSLAAQAGVLAARARHEARVAALEY